MENFHDLLIHRHSIRKYTDQPISAENVRTIMEAALMAPSSKRSTPWEFILVEDKDKLKLLSECREFGASPIAKCSLAILVCADPTITDTWIEDASIAASYIQLQAQALGLGSCWIQIRGRFTKEEETSQDYISGIISLPENLQILCAITLGHKDEERKPFDLEKLLWEKIHIAK